MSPTQHWQRELVYCALRRAGGPRRADAAFLDEVTGLALENRAEPADVADLTVQKLHSVMRGLEKCKRVEVAGLHHDTRTGRDVPLYRPLAGFNGNEIPPAPPQPDPQALAIEGLRQGRKLARRLGAQPDPHKAKLEKFFRDWTNDSAGLLLDFKKKIDNLVARYDKRYQALVEEVEG